MSGHRIIVITDGAAALLHTPPLLAALRRNGHTVKVAPTGYDGASALAFVGELGWAALSGHPALDLSRLTPETLGWAELVILAPVSPAVLQVFRQGSALALLKQSARPVLAAPAHLPGDGADAALDAWLRELPPGSRLLEGRPEELMELGAMGNVVLAPVPTVVECAEAMLSAQPLAGERVLVTAGPTAEDLDPVRYLTNRSSGKMGVALALAAVRFGARVTIVHGPMATALPRVPGLDAVPVRSAREMHDAVAARWQDATIAILAAAVADFTPDHCAPQKLKKHGDAGLTLQLVRTADILAELGERCPRPFLVGFAAESDDVEINALAKLRRKHCDLICANDIRAHDTGFAVDTNQVTIYDRDGTRTPLPLLSKRATAEAILDYIARRKS